MTKPEPLKDKVEYAIFVVDRKVRTEHIIYLKDVKSALEWYKKYESMIGKFTEDYPGYSEEVALLLDECLTLEYTNLVFNKWILNKAFEDILNKDQNE